MNECHFFTVHKQEHVVRASADLSTTQHDTLAKKKQNVHLHLIARTAHAPKQNIRLTTEFATMLQMFAKMANVKVPFVLTTVLINVHAMRWVICVKCVVTILWYVVEMTSEEIECAS